MNFPTTENGDPLFRIYNLAERDPLALDYTNGGWISSISEVEGEPVVARIQADNSTMFYLVNLQTKGEISLGPVPQLVRNFYGNDRALIYFGKTEIGTQLFAMSLPDGSPLEVSPPNSTPVAQLQNDAVYWLEEGDNGTKQLRSMNIANGNSGRAELPFPGESDGSLAFNQGHWVVALVDARTPYPHSTFYQLKRTAYGSTDLGGELAP